MRVPRWLKFLTAILVVVALIRAINGAGAISFYDIILRLQNFEFDTSGIDTLISMFSGNYDLAVGQEGETLDYVVAIFVGIKDFFVACWNVIKESFRMIALIFELFFEVLGFNVDFTSDFTGGSVGRR